MPDRQGNLSPEEQRDLIVQAMMQGLYPQAGDHVSPLPGLFPGGQTLNSAQLALNPLASNGGADPFTQPGVDYLPGQQYNPTDQTAPMGAPGTISFGPQGPFIDTVYDPSLTAPPDPGAPVPGSVHSLQGPPAPAPPNDPNAPAPAPNVSDILNEMDARGGIAGGVQAMTANPDNPADFNSTATPSGSNPPGFEGAPAATPGNSTTYGGPQGTGAFSVESNLENDEQAPSNAPAPGAPSIDTQGLTGHSSVVAGMDPAAAVSNVGFSGPLGSYTDYTGIPGLGLEGNPGVVGGYSANPSGVAAYSATQGDPFGGYNSNAPAMAPSNSWDTPTAPSVDPTGKGDRSDIPSDVLDAYAMAGQTPGLETSFDNPGFSGFGFGFGDYSADPSAGDYTGDTGFGGAPGGGGISDGSYSDATSGGGYGTDGFDGFDGFDDGFDDDGDDDGDDE